MTPQTNIFEKTIFFRKSLTQGRIFSKKNSPKFFACEKFPNFSRQLLPAKAEVDKTMYGTAIAVPYPENCTLQKAQFSNFKVQFLKILQKFSKIWPPTAQNFTKILGPTSFFEEKTPIQLGISEKFANFGEFFEPEIPNWTHIPKFAQRILAHNADFKIYFKNLR